MKKLIIGAVSRPDSLIKKYSKLSGSTNTKAIWSIVIAIIAMYLSVSAENFLFCIIYLMNFLVRWERILLHVVCVLPQQVTEHKYRL